LKILVLTQKVDSGDDLLGFMHGWIEEFAKQCERVTVICLQEGAHELPSNVTTLSLGKPSSRLRYILNFYKYIWRERKNYDTVFVHMNPEYIILGGLLWRLWGKRVSLWYAHGHVPWILRLAERFCDIIFTSTKSGCRLKNEKIKVIGQGIDTKKFRINLPVGREKLKINDFLKIISIGRISPVKDYETLILAGEILKNRGLNFSVDIIGGAGLPEQENYLATLKGIVGKKNLSERFNFLGPKPNNEILKYLQSSDLFVNTSRTGSLDKAIVEAMSVGLPILTCNEALQEVLGDYKDRLIYPRGDYKRLAEKILEIEKMSSDERQKLGGELREIVVRDHSLESFVSKIVVLGS